MPSSHDAPPRALPLLYFATGYISLSLAFAAVAFTPRSLGGFYYHARLIGVVHLVTLGWITSTILGLLYLVLPTQLRMPLPVRRGDYWAFASFVIGVIGMVSHFWIGEFGGMAWSGLMVALAIFHLGGRVVPRIIQAPAPLAAKLPLSLAFANIALAAIAGVVLGFDKVHHFLPGYVVSNVLAHAHLAALGWACMMTLGLISLLIEHDATADATGRSRVATALLLEAAALGLSITLLLSSRWSVVFAGLGAWAFARFLPNVVAIVRERSASPRPDPDVGGWHVVGGAVYLLIAVPLGLALAWMDTSDLTLRLALVYGVCGLVGFVAQCLMGVQMRLVPLVWRANADRLSAIPAFVMWSAAVPLLAVGFFVDSATLLSVAGAAGCVATIATAVQVIAEGLARPRSLLSRRDDSHRRSAAQQHAVPQSRP